MSDLNKKYTKNDEIIARKNPNGSVVLMKMDDSEIFYKIEGVAAELWKGLEEGQTPNEVMEVLLEEFDCTREQLEADATSFIEELVSKEMLS